MVDKNKNTIQRRSFVKSAALVGSTFMIVKPESVYGAPANSRLQLGVIGCGGRGNYDTSEFMRNTDTVVTAIADFFQDRIDSTKQNFDRRQEAQELPKIDPARTFAGIDSYQKLLETDVDMVLITSPPYFHPLHFTAAVDAGKHIYMEKPVSTDVAGAKKVLEAGKKAKGKQSCVVGFQLRKSEGFQGVVQRVHEGAIGDIVFGQVTYLSGRLGAHNTEGLSQSEARLRNWVFDQELSGDIIVEQNVHVLDIGNWYIQSHPTKAVGTGGRKARTDVGDCWDHFVCTYTYPNDVYVDFASGQFLKGFGDCRERMFGTKGTADTAYSGHPNITGENPWQAESDSPLDGTVAAKVVAFVDSVKSGEYLNEVEQGAETTLTGILGRIAAYTGEEVTWEQMINSNQTYDVKLDL